jgi:ectoine hydroxylase-related dioxygenase (phytanoyl-CoA dioxygenase family)
VNTRSLDIDAAIIERYRDEGAVVLRDAIAPQWLDLLAEGVEYNRRHPSEWSHWYTDPDEAVGFWSDYVTWPRVEQYRRVVYDSGLAAVAGALMQSSSVRFFHEHVLVKEPGAAEPTPWHHDDPYYGVDGLRT